MQKKKKSDYKFVLKKVKIWLLDLIYPRRCVVCDQIITSGKKGICPECQDKLQIIREPACMKCGKALEDERKEFCPDCMKRKHIYTRGFSAFAYNDAMKKSIYRYKYGNRREYADYYSSCMCDLYADTLQRIKPDCLLPVPLHRKKQKKRGFNQAALLAEKISEKTGIPYKDNYLVRCRNTRPLKTLSRTERENNLKRAFKLGRNDVKLDTVVLIDDIYTTGSTVDEIASLLIMNGTKQVYFLTLASGNN